MIINTATALDLWYTAVAQEFGLRLVLADPSDATIRSLQKLLYEVRKDADDPELNTLTVNLPAGGKEVWLTKNTTNMNEGPIERRLIRE